MDRVLVALILLPLVGAALVLASPPRRARLVAAAVAVLELGLALDLVLRVGGADFSVPWIPSLGIALHLGLDGLNSLLVVLAALLTTVALLLAPDRLPRPQEFGMWMLLLLGGLEGVFLSQNLGCFYVFWEIMLIPAWLLLLRWGRDTSGRVPMKFFLYTLAGSLGMLLAVASLAFLPGGAPDLEFQALALRVGTMSSSPALLLLFTLGFLVKVPLVPLHGWLVETYENAPAPVTALVAGAMSKAGVYGFLKVGLGVFPGLVPTLSAPLAALAILTLLYGAAGALAARRVRQVLAWSSMSHMGMMMLGVASMQPSGLAGSSLQMFNHGLTTGGLFLLVGLLEDRGVPMDLDSPKGLAARMPRTAAVFLLLAMASLGLPGLCSFPAELLMLNGAWIADPTWAALGGLGVVASGWYTLRLFQGLMHGPASEAGGPEDLGWSSLAPLIPLLILVVALGVFPGPAVDLVTGALNLPGFAGLPGGTP